MRRILRLWPIYIIVCGLGLWIYQFPSFDEIAATPDWIWPLSTFTTNIAITLHKEHFGALGVFWTLALEEQFYLMAGILFKKYQTNVLIVIFSLIILACAIWRFFPSSFSCFLHYRIQLPVSLLSILTGCMLALYQQKWGLNIARKNRFWLGFFVLISGLSLVIWEYPFPLKSSHCALIMFVADVFVLALLLLCLAKEGLVQYVMSFRFPCYVGRLSLCIYAINIPVIFFYVFIKEYYLPTSSLLQQHPKWQFILDTGMIFFLNILLASLWQLIEEPIAELRHQFRPGQNPDIHLKMKQWLLHKLRFFVDNTQTIASYVASSRTRAKSPHTTQHTDTYQGG